MRSIHPFAEYEVEIRCESSDALFYQALFNFLQKSLSPNVLDGIICASSLLVQFNGFPEFELVESEVQRFEFEPIASQDHELLEIPVCYNDIFAIDKQDILNRLEISWESLVRLHTETIYQVSMHGFVPGFAYLKNLPEQLRIERKEKPLTHVPQGSVAIADGMTGIYPFELPGGWHIIGRTPMRLFAPEESDAILLKLGQLVRFREIDLKEYRHFSR